MLAQGKGAYPGEGEYQSEGVIPRNTVHADESQLIFQII